MGGSNPPGEPIPRVLRESGPTRGCLIWTRSHLCFQVNGTQAHLPLPLAGDPVHVYFSGSGAVLQTETGLLVAYDWCNHLCVMAPETYVGALWVGTSMGTPKMTTVAPMTPCCPTQRSFCTQLEGPGLRSRLLRAPLCLHDREGQYQSLAFCGLLRATTGPSRPATSQPRPKSPWRAMSTTSVPPGV